MNKTSLVIGAGEIGQGLFEVLNGAYQGHVFIRDVDEPKGLPEKIDYIHICIPGTLENFDDVVLKYIDMYEPTICVIHSTVEIGTTYRIQMRSEIDILYSFVRGKHPEIARGIRTFTKFIAGYSRTSVKEIAGYFRKSGMKIYEWYEPKDVEAAKLVSLAYYNTVIKFCKQVDQMCDEKDLNFTMVYTLPQQTYNEGYDILGDRQYCRPVLEPVPGKIGGHCVTQNMHLLDTDFADELIKYNESL